MQYKSSYSINLYCFIYKNVFNLTYFLCDIIFFNFKHFISDSFTRLNHFWQFTRSRSYLNIKINTREIQNVKISLGICFTNLPWILETQLPKVFWVFEHRNVSPTVKKRNYKKSTTKYNRYVQYLQIRYRVRSYVFFIYIDVWKLFFLNTSYRHTSITLVRNRLNWQIKIIAMNKQCFICITL